jgi:hypothetical protein
MVITTKTMRIAPALSGESDDPLGGGSASMAAQPAPQPGPAQAFALVVQPRMQVRNPRLRRRPH